MKPRLLIFHDIHGPRQSFLSAYQELLIPHFKIRCYDLEELGGIDPSVDRHIQYTEFGIRAAVENILKLEKTNTDPRFILGFSVGATIAFDLALQGLSFKYLLGLSGTRIRTYTKFPAGNIDLIYGTNDKFRPNEEWLNRSALCSELLIETDHNFYSEEKFIKQFSTRIIAALQKA